ncbi:MAG: hypothetical protein M1827_001515 [Pycnora praestabilis]|nr:MAG: hypothetical protein M1827_001515 [Pycnora praestabilis]
MASSQLARRHSGNTGSSSAPYKMKAARVAKATSAGNSPRRSDKRRTGVPHNSTRHRPTLDDHFEFMFGAAAQQEEGYSRERAGRPSTWHPVSQVIHQPISHGSSKPIQQTHMEEPYPVGFYPDMVARSSSIVTSLPYVGPISPVPVYFETYEEDCFPSLNHESEYYSQHYSSTMTPISNDPFTFAQNLPTQNPYEFTSEQYPEPAQQLQAWNYYPYGHPNGTSAPPTPDFLPIQHPPALDNEQMHQKQPRKPGQGGKELIGMGLYDSPERISIPDMALDNYRSLMMSKLLGSSHRTYEPTGKGLKLEETWRPPPPEGEDEDDETCSTTDSLEGLSCGSIHENNSILHTDRPFVGDLSNHTFFFESADAFGEDRVLHESGAIFGSKAQDAGLRPAPWL